MPQTWYHSPIGIIRITVTESYVEEVHFCEKEELSDMSQEISWNALLQNCTDQLIEYFSGHRRQFDLPVSQTGTGFQQQVWGELTAISFGRTISYMDLARKLGDPKVIRAAASANGKNNIAIIVPCHRVIGTNREMVGYAGGIGRKKWLLDHERKIAHGVQTLF
ncbi:methylated-DNA--[protein]-cysteine S-methyltransferase [Flavihumibacter sp. ZG627]|uniref:methylated-DNA--[protein]-cysteine S-methyltransferase n=1 Tax=Flavihumibacter sp. ZG627 TaxID=1463156 RepID=UPI00057F019D|nr:methylated-DNA--[protein]-cysteine S-methyltransferase [Flavihumibacter sp. ZG627]KIC91782.1 cysteine methyltransferase [Flavihumibacter sp. ZG627]